MTTRTILLFTCILATTALASSQASAQDTWLILPVGIGEEPAAVTDHASVTGAALETTVGATVLQGDLLQHRLENTVSLPYTDGSADVLAAQLAEAEPDLLTAVSRHRDGDVIARVDQILQQARGSLALQRDATASTTLARICAYGVRAQLHSSGEASARQRARQCLGLVPGFSLAADRHPPNVRELYDAESRSVTGAIVVSGSRDDPPGCTVRVHGRAVGRTPSARTALPPGDYRVQVECSDQPGRVHMVHVDAQPVEVVVRGTLDDALRTSPPALVYPSPSALQMLPGDLGHAGRAVGADYALAVIQRDRDEGLMQSFRITEDGPPQFLAERTFELHGDPSELRESAAQLARSTLDDPNTETAPSEGSGGVSPVGPILLGGGGAVLVAGLIMAGVAAAQDQDLIDRCPERVGCDPAMQSDVEATRNLAIAADVLWIAGATIAVTGLVLTFVLEEGQDADASTTAELRGIPGGGVASLRWRLP